MAPSVLAQRRTQNLLLFQKLLNLRDGASPFTLLLDTLEQSALPVVQEFVTRAKLSKTKIIFISFQTLRKPKLADVFVTARKKDLKVLGQEISTYLPKPQATSSSGPKPKTLLIIDSLHPLAATHPSRLPNFLSSLISSTTSLLATYHTDIPIPLPPLASQDPSALYSPDPLTTLMYLATAILRIDNLSHVIEKKRARDRSLEEPVFGLQEGREGVLFGLQGLKADGVVVEMEVKRKSGRGVLEIFVLSTSTSTPTTAEGIRKGELGSKICLLEDHPLYAPLAAMGIDNGGLGDGEVETTFNLGLTEKQWRDREGVVLPYFDAQRGEGGGEGGRILYEMDRVDDFDEEEDEI